MGLAFGDDIGVATPLPALAFSDPAKQWEGIVSVVRDRKITDIVIGHPLNMDGTSGPKAQEVEVFARKLHSEFGLPVHLVDERLTSYEAESTIAPARRRAVRKSGLIDSRAATLILQDFLDGRIPAAEGEEGET
jgi:putative Holliday junction resolvase